MQLWRRFSNIDTDYAIHSFNDIIKTSDGGYLAVGFQINGRRLENEPTSQSIIVKTNAEGKVESSVSSSTIDIDKNGNIEFSFYPNPAINRLFINHNSDKKFRYQIISEKGQLYKKFNSSPFKLTYILEVSDLNSGNYYLIVQDENDNILGQELIVVVK